MSVLDSPAVQTVLAREHGRAAGDRERMDAARPLIEAAKAQGKPYNHLYPTDVYLAVTPEMGRFLYLAALSVGARRIVEFGTSFGISTVYLAAAASETGGAVTGTEMEPGKAERALVSLSQAGLAEVAEVRTGDALETLPDVAGGVDLLFLDGWKELYLPVLELMEPKLAPGALVLADNIHTFPEETRPYVDRVNRPDGPYRSVTLPFDSGLEYSLYMTDRR